VKSFPIGRWKNKPVPPIAEMDVSTVSEWIDNRNLSSVYDDKPLFEGVTKKSMAKDIASRTYWAVDETLSKDATLIPVRISVFGSGELYLLAVINGPSGSEHSKPEQ
jgi:hypothetical protein